MIGPALGSRSRERGRVRAVVTEAVAMKSSVLRTCQRDTSAVGCDTDSEVSHSGSAPTHASDLTRSLAAT